MGVIRGKNRSRVAGWRFFDECSAVQFDPAPILATHPDMHVRGLKQVFTGVDLEAIPAYFHYSRHRNLRLSA